MTDSLKDLKFPALEDLARQMDAPPSAWFPDEKARLRQMLKEGKEFKNLNEIRSVYGGLLTSCEGEQICVYIKDPRTRKRILENEPGERPRYHIFECRTLRYMRYLMIYKHRYVRMIERDGMFDIIATDGRGWSKKHTPLKLDLMVCKNCLKELNYKCYADTYDEKKKTEIHRSFSLKNFFSEWRAVFLNKPEHTNITGQPDSYPSNWRDITSSYRGSKNFTCEKCGVCLEDKQYQHLCHTHHLNVRRSDNQPENFAALCVECHAEQHPHMPCPLDAKSLLRRLREEQGLAPLI